MRYIFILILVCNFVQVNGQVDSARLFVFGHSLIDHRPPSPPTPSDETTVMHWVSIVADYQSKHFAGGGIYGFLPTHANNLPTSPNWYYDTVNIVWDDSIHTFGEANIKDVMITPGNFIQSYPPTMMYYGPDSIYTPLTATAKVFNWVDAQQTSPMRYYIYENWPEMSNFLSNDIPPTNAEWQAYNQFLLGDFHDWFITYQDSLLLRFPDLSPRMIPVGPILSKLLNSPQLANIPFGDLYQDADPHGRPTIYFLAGMVTYMALYAEAVPVNIPIDPIVHQDVRDNFGFIIDNIWDELINFVDGNGDSRVFYDDSGPAHVSVTQNDITIYPNPTSGTVVIDGQTALFDIDVLDSLGNIIQSYSGSDRIQINIASWPSNVYFLRMINSSNGQISVEKIIKQ